MECAERRQQTKHPTAKQLDSRTQPEPLPSSLTEQTLPPQLRTPTSASILCVPTRPRFHTSRPCSVLTGSSPKQDIEESARPPHEPWTKAVDGAWPKSILKRRPFSDPQRFNLNVHERRQHVWQGRDDSSRSHDVQSKRSCDARRFRGLE